MPTGRAKPFRKALNLLRRDRKAQDSLRCRKLRAMLSDHYRSRLLFGNTET
jgi:hypothetical protein